MRPRMYARPSFSRLLCDAELVQLRTAPQSSDQTFENNFNKALKVIGVLWCYPPPLGSLSAYTRSPLIRRIQFASFAASRIVPSTVLKKG